MDQSKQPYEQRKRSLEEKQTGHFQEDYYVRSRTTSSQLVSHSKPLPKTFLSLLTSLFYIPSYHLLSTLAILRHQPLSQIFVFSAQTVEILLAISELKASLAQLLPLTLFVFAHPPAILLFILQQVAPFLSIKLTFCCFILTELSFLFSTIAIVLQLLPFHPIICLYLKLKWLTF